LDLLAFYPESHEAHVTLAELYRDSGRKRDARWQYDAAIKLLQEKRDRL
jgi:Tfp pilus assembly protein PilF